MQLNQGGPAGFLSSLESSHTNDETPAAPATKSKAAKREEKLAAERARQQKLIQKLLEEKRPRTTEWEKYADMLALFRKFNPHDAFRRNGTLTKFTGHGGHFGAVPIKEKPFHGRGDDDSSDTTSNWGRKTPVRRSSARQGGRLQRQPHRPTSASQRSVNGSAARNGNNVTKNAGRKFDFNPSRSRVSSSVSSGQNLASLPSTANAYRLSPSLGTQSSSHSHESVKSPLVMRSQHSTLGTTFNHQALETIHQDELNGQQSKQRHYFQTIQTPPTPLQLTTGGSSMPPDAMPYPHLQQSILTRESSTTSLSSQTRYPGQIRSYKSSMDLRRPTLLDPLQHHHNPQNLPPVRNTSSFLSTPRTSPFGITKSYTDLYFSSTSNKENETSYQMDLSYIAQQRLSRETSPYRIRERCEVCSNKYIKT